MLTALQRWNFNNVKDECLTVVMVLLRYFKLKYIFKDCYACVEVLAHFTEIVGNVLKVQRRTFRLRKKKAPHSLDLRVTQYSQSGNGFKSRTGVYFRQFLTSIIKFKNINNIRPIEKKNKQTEKPLQFAASLPGGHINFMICLISDATYQISVTLPSFNSCLKVSRSIRKRDVINSFSHLNHFFVK